MSLINDALKRARQTQQKNPPGGPPLFPAEIRTSGGIGWFLPLVIILLVFGAGIFITLALVRRPASPKPAAVAAPDLAATQQIVSAPPPVATNAAPPAGIAPLAAKTNTTNTSAISNFVPPPPPPPPEPKLQGIFFTPPNPSAIVNGKTVYAGDHVAEFTVKEIGKNSVTLQNADGSLKTLVIGQ
jgi:hypothetical protein